MRRDRNRPFYLNIWHTGAPGNPRRSPSNTIIRSRGMTVPFENGTTPEDRGGQFYLLGQQLDAGDSAGSRRRSWPPRPIAPRPKER